MWQSWCEWRQKIWIWILILNLLRNTYGHTWICIPLQRNTCGHIIIDSHFLAQKYVWSYIDLYSIAGKYLDYFYPEMRMVIRGFDFHCREIPGLLLPRNTYGHAWICIPLQGNTWTTFIPRLTPSCLGTTTRRSRESARTNAPKTASRNETLCAALSTTR